MAEQVIRRRARTGAIVTAVLLVLCGCSASPEPTGTLIDAAQLEGLVFKGDLALPTPFDLTFRVDPHELKATTITEAWTQSSGSPEECFASYSASYLVNGKPAGTPDEFAEIAGYYPENGSGINVFGRAFLSTDAATAFIDGLTDSARECTTAGGYQLYAGEGTVGWDVTGITVTPATALTLPEGVTAVYQEEHLVPGYAELYRVTMLRYSNVVVAVMAQEFAASDFTTEQVDELAEDVAGRLAKLG